MALNEYGPKLLNYLLCGCKKIALSYFNLLQGDPNQNPLFQMAVPQKVCISDPMLEKPKCVYLKNCKQTAEKCKQIFEN